MSVVGAQPGSVGLVVMVGCSAFNDAGLWCGGGLGCEVAADGVVCGELTLGGVGAPAVGEEQVGEAFGVAAVFDDFDGLTAAGAGDVDVPVGGEGAGLQERVPGGVVVGFGDPVELGVGEVPAGEEVVPAVGLPADHGPFGGDVGHGVGAPYSSRSSRISSQG